jgi:pyruvate kinase
VSARRAKLVCTLGPATASPERVRALAEAGTEVFRVNLSHGDRSTHALSIDLARSVAEERGEDLAVMADLPGPKIRLGELANGEIRLDAGGRFELRAGVDAGHVDASVGGPDALHARGDALGAEVTYPGLARDLRPGDRVLLSDGAVEMTVVAIEITTVVCEVIRGGRIRSGAGVNVPAERLSLPGVTGRDRQALAEALERGVDLVAQSFVRSGSDVSDLRVLMGERDVPVVAKIETRPAVDDIGSILGQADAIMVARGDLGVELPMEEIPILQKQLLRDARAAGRPVIVATQMLESMIASPRPTRAEATDVANAVLDGADAIMLSGETAIGEFPVEAARAASRIAEVAQGVAGEFGAAPVKCTHTDEASAVAHAAAQIASDDRSVVAIACFTGTGRTAGLLSAERPGVPIYAFVPDPGVRRSLSLRWGVRPLPARVPADTDEMIALMDEDLRTEGFCAEGQSVVMAASSPAGKTHTNLLKVHHIGETVL